ncbi:MAG TPA: hypothetical protein PKN63_07025 [Chitinophagales bacterium]|nr:hypothetical protein [Chitinophagales bacterium]
MTKEFENMDEKIDKKYCKKIIKTIFDTKNPLRIPVTKKELYSFLGIYGITEKKYSKEVESCLEDFKAIVNDNYGLKRYSVDGKQSRSYLMWSVKKNWRPKKNSNMNKASIDKIILLKNTINLRKYLKNPTNIENNDLKKTIKKKTVVVEVRKTVSQDFILVEQVQYILSVPIPYRIRIWNQVILLLLEFVNLV